MYKIWERIDLTCDECGDVANYTDIKSKLIRILEEQTKQIAMIKGWRIGKDEDDKCLCPKCDKDTRDD